MMQSAAPILKPVFFYLVFLIVFLNVQSAKTEPDSTDSVTMMTDQHSVKLELTLMRHGFSCANVIAEEQGDPVNTLRSMCAPDASLSSLGMRQAASADVSSQYDGYGSSYMTRAIETALGAFPPGVTLTPIPYVNENRALSSDQVGNGLAALHLFNDGDNQPSPKNEVMQYFCDTITPDDQCSVKTSLGFDSNRLGGDTENTQALDFKYFYYDGNFKRMQPSIRSFFVFLTGAEYGEIFDEVSSSRQPKRVGNWLEDIYQRKVDQGGDTSTIRIIIASHNHYIQSFLKYLGYTKKDFGSIGNTKRTTITFDRVSRVGDSHWVIQRLNKRKLPVLFQIPNSELNPQLDAILMKPTVEFGDASRCSKVQKVTKPSDNNYIQCLERLTNGIKPQMQAALGLEASLSPPTKKKTSISTLKSPLSELQRTLDGVKSRIRSYTMSTSVPGSSETETGIAASVSKPASPLEDDSDSGRRPRLTKKTGFRMKAGDQSSLALSEALGKGERVRRALKHVALI